MNIENKILNQIQFKDIVSSDTSGVARCDSTALFAIKSRVSGIGFDHLFNATAFALSKDQISDKVETSRGLYWQRLIEKTEFDSTSYNAQRMSIRQRLLARKQNLAFTNWYNYLKEQADIEYNRKMFNL